MRQQSLEERFVARMRELRLRRSWNQSDLARQLSAVGLDWKQQTVARAESEGRALRLDEAHAIASLFGQTVESMVSADSHELPERAMRILGPLQEQLNECLTGLQALLDAHVTAGTTKRSSDPVIAIPFEEARNILLTQRLEALTQSVRECTEHAGRAFVICVMDERALDSYRGGPIRIDAGTDLK